MTGFMGNMRDLPDFYCGQGASPEAIVNAEGTLGLSFADDYRDYLASFGIASANGHELTGLIDSERLNVVDVTNFEKAMNPLVPDGLYAIENLGFDGAVAWQDATGCVYRSLSGQKPAPISPSLLDFLQL